MTKYLEGVVCPLHDYKKGHVWICQKIEADSTFLKSPGPLKMMRRFFCLKAQSICQKGRQKLQNMYTYKNLIAVLGTFDTGASNIFLL